MDTGNPPLGGDGGWFAMIPDNLLFPPRTGTIDPVRPTLPGPITIWESDHTWFGGPPLFAGLPIVAPNGVASWALMNLILSAIGAVFAIMITIRTLLRRKREDDQEPEYEQADQKTEQRKGRMAWLAVAILMGVIGIVLFLLTQDMSRMMVWLDIWTIVHAVVFVVQAVAVWFLLRSDKKKDEDDSTGFDPLDFTEEVHA